MGKIYYLMGKSSSGKDTIFRMITKESDLNLKTIVPYTTRPIRAGEVEGKQYHFVDEDRFNALKNEGKVIEDRAYNTYHGLWRYFMVDDGRIDLDSNSYIIIGTLESFLKCAQYYGREKTVPIMIDLDDGVRLERALKRERKQDNPKYEELCRRFLADSADFSEEKLKEAGITARFDNTNLDECLRNIIEYIKNN